MNMLKKMQALDLGMSVDAREGAQVSHESLLGLKLGRTHLHM